LATDNRQSWRVDTQSAYDFILPFLND
jgi:hypothetical protein